MDLDLEMHGDAQLARRFGSVASSPPCFGPSDDDVRQSISNDRWDEDAESCSICHALLGRRRLRLRHHCRICGRCICGPCSPNMIAMPGAVALQRACTPCLAIAHKAPVLKSRLSQLGAKLVSLSSHSVAIIPLESLEGMLQLCEDALAPLEGLQGRVDAAEAEAQRAAAEVEQERSRVRRLESRLAKAAEAVQGLESRLRKWLKAGPQDAEQREEKPPPSTGSLEQSVESCGELMTRLESVKPPVTMPSTSRGEQWEPDSSQCSLCSVHLGKRHLRPRHHCRFCGRCVCGKCSKSSIASDHTVQRCCTRCVQPVVQSHTLWRRLTRVAEALAAPTGAGAPWQGFDQVLRHCEEVCGLPPLRTEPTSCGP